MWLNVLYYRCTAEQIARLQEVGGQVRDTIIP